MLVRQFSGRDDTQSPTRLPPEKAQEDLGGDHSVEGAWRRRKGLRHVDDNSTTSEITGVLGWHARGGDRAVLVVSGTEVHGLTNLDMR